MAEAKKDLILSADIGGTKTFLGLFLDMGDHLKLVKEGTFINTNFSGHNQILGEFLEKSDIRRLESAALGVASPVEANRCRLTNLDWEIDGRQTGALFKIRKLTLLNDLVAIAWGIGLLSSDDIHTIQKGAERSGNAALIAAGTGLGEAVLFWDGKSHVPSPSEGGHADFAPRGALEMGLLKFLQERFGHVSYERVLSGPGLENVYSFIRKRSGAPEPQYLRKRFEMEGVSPVVSDEAINGKDKDCKAALELFISVYGAEAGNLALKVLSVGGVYVGGGIAPKILPAIGENFLASFRKKGRFEDMLSQIPVHVILNEKTGLLGAAFYASTLNGKRQRVVRIIDEKDHSL